MTMRKKLLGTLASYVFLAAAPAAVAQLDELDPDLVPLPGIVDEVSIADPGPLAFAPMGGPPGKGCPMGDPGGAGGPGGPFAFLQGDLALTDEQFEKLFQIKNQFLDKAGPKMLELTSSRRELKDYLTRPQLDKVKIKELQNRINDSRAALANLCLDEKLSALAVLTEEQRKELRKRIIQGCGPGGKFMLRHERKEIRKG